MSKEQELIFSLLKCEVLKTGNFKLKDGTFSPIYIDLRKIIHYPEVVKDLVAAIRAKQTEENVKADAVCGVPYTAIPIASVFSAFYNIPLIMKRKEAKDYGTKRLVEGNFKTGDSCLLIEDIVCTGTSIMETLEALRREGLNVQHCVVVVNRNQGGMDNLKKVGVSLYPLFDIESVFNVYCSINRVEPDLVKKITSYLSENANLSFHKDITYSALSYSERSKISNHPVARRLLQIMEDKKTNLCVAIDTTHCLELIKLAEQLGPHICLLKIHIDILNDFDENLVKELIKLSSVHNFLILEDRRFADIGSTVVQQYSSGMYKIQTWADLVTVHAIPGSDTIEALKSSLKTDKRACVLIAEISAADALTSKVYTESAFQLANNHEDFVLGYVARQRHPKGKNLICMYPGNLFGNSLNQQYKLPEEAVADGADIIIVDRGIFKATDIVASIVEYKTKCFKAYLNRIS